MKNQNGEAFTFVMVVMMVGMLFLGGMALMHRDQTSHSTKEHEQEYSEKTQHIHNSDRENASTPVEDESKF